MGRKESSRRDFLRGLAVAIGSGLVAAACGPRQSQPSQPETPAVPIPPTNPIPPTKVPALPTETARGSQEEITLTSGERERAKGEFVKAYEEWKGRYVTPDGTPEPNQLRVRRPVIPEFEDDTVSEGIGYGMILAAHADDEKKFIGLWNYAQAYLIEGKGLMIWRIDADGEPLDSDSATDANIDIAYALMVADLKWGDSGGYQGAAVSMINNIMEYCVEKETYILKPGDDWGGSLVINPSFLSPGQFRLFGKYNGDSRWEKVTQKSREIMGVIVQRSPSSLVPEYTTGKGEKITDPKLIRKLKDREEYQDLDYYGYNATRAYWRQAMAALWFGDEQAIQSLQRANAFFDDFEPDEIVSGYSLKGDELGVYHLASFIAPVVAASIVSSDPEYRRKFFYKLVSLEGESYFSDSLRALTFLLLSGIQEEDLGILS